MEQRNQRRPFPSKQCQVDGCEEISVGPKVPLCRKHRNKTYKQNYKKKKRNAGANVEEKEIVIDDQYLLEQKYSNMLQDVLSQKQLELFESPSVVSLLRNYQIQMARSNSKNNHEISQTGSKISEQSNSVEQQLQLEDTAAFKRTKSTDTHEINQSTLTSSLNHTHSYSGEWNSSKNSDTLKTLEGNETSLLSSTSIVPETSVGSCGIPVTSSFLAGFPARKWFSGVP